VPHRDPRPLAGDPARAIHAIEADRPYLFIKGAVIKPAAPAGKPDPTQEPILEAQLDVVGVVRVAGGKP
jgi:hypothetical protein